MFLPVTARLGGVELSTRGRFFPSGYRATIRFARRYPIPAKPGKITVVATSKVLFRSSELHIVVDAVSRVYCPHRVHVSGSGKRLDALLEVVREGNPRIVGLKYSAPVRVDAEDFPQLMLIQTCLQGSGAATQAGISAQWRRNQTLPLSPSLSTQLAFDGSFVQRSVRLDVGKVEAYCSRLLNAPLQQRLRFELRPFAPPGPTQLSAR